jgi:hypothetical protein
MEPHRDPIDIAPVGDGVAVTSVPDRQTAQAWLDAEHPVLMRMVPMAAAAGFDAHAWQLAWGLVEYFDLLGYPNDIASTQRVALAAAARLGNREAEGRASRLLANADIQMGNLDRADQHLQRAPQVFADRQDAAGQANTHMNLAVCANGRSRSATRTTMRCMRSACTAGPVIVRAKGSP